MSTTQQQSTSMPSTLVLTEHGYQFIQPGEQPNNDPPKIYRIALVNHANPEIKEHWVVCSSKRRNRAIEQTRKLLANPPFVDNKRLRVNNLMLFHFLPDGTRRPVSLKHREPRMRVQQGATPVGERSEQQSPTAQA